MIKTIAPTVWAYDLEWVPDAQSGRVLYGLPPEMPEIEVLTEMWKRNGATPEDPMPFLKTVLCRVVSVAAVMRTAPAGGEPSVKLIWLPRDTADASQASEREVVGKFLQAVGKHHPQLVGFNSKASDLKVLVQRGVVLGLHQPEFCRRPVRRDDPTPDYFARWDGDAHLDLMELLAGWGKASVSLNEAAALSGIPGKFKTEGEQVAALWLAGRHKEIVQYNCFDALTTYLLWLRMAHFSGHFTRDQYEEEQERLREMIMTLAEDPEGAYLEAYLEEWDRLQTATGQL